MEDNPYQSPSMPAEEPKKRGLRGFKHPVGYLVALFLGGWLMGGLLMPWLAPLDDSGGVQMMVGAFVSVVVYHFLF